MRHVVLKGSVLATKRITHLKYLQTHCFSPSLHLLSWNLVQSQGSQRTEKDAFLSPPTPPCRLSSVQADSATAQPKVRSSIRDCPRRAPWVSPRLRTRLRTRWVCFVLFPGGFVLLTSFPHCHIAHSLFYLKIFETSSKMVCLRVWQLYFHKKLTIMR